MRKVTILVINALLIIAFSSCDAQTPCEEVTLGDVFQSLQEINVERGTKLRFKNASSFNFSKFTPTDHKIDSAFYKVGYNEKNEIEEIVYEAHKTKLTFVTYNFDNYRILLVKEVLNKEVLFHVIAFVIMKDGHVYLLNLSEQFYDKGYVQRTTSFFRGSIGTLSAVMTLDENLKPIELFKFMEKQLVEHSFFVYNKDKTLLRYEVVSFAFNTPSRPSVQINSSSCLQRFDENKVMDYSLTLNPENDGLPNNLLWLYHGAHGYRTCVNK